MSYARRNTRSWWTPARAKTRAPRRYPPPHAEHGRGTTAKFDRWSSNIVVRKGAGLSAAVTGLSQTFFGLPGGWLEVLEFPCFFRGISFCSDPGPADASRFAPGRSAMYPGSRNDVHRERFRGKERPPHAKAHVACANFYVRCTNFP